MTAAAPAVGSLTLKKSSHEASRGCGTNRLDEADPTARHALSRLPRTELDNRYRRRADSSPAQPRQSRRARRTRAQLRGQARDAGHVPALRLCGDLLRPAPQERQRLGVMAMPALAISTYGRARVTVVG